MSFGRARNSKLDLVGERADSTLSCHLETLGDLGLVTWCGHLVLHHLVLHDLALHHLVPSLGALHHLVRERLVSPRLCSNLRRSSFFFFCSDSTTSQKRASRSCSSIHTPRYIYTHHTSLRIRRYLHTTNTTIHTRTSHDDTCTHLTRRTRRYIHTHDTSIHQYPHWIDTHG